MRKALRTARLIVCGALIVAGAGVALLFGYAAVAAPEANVRWGSLFMLGIALAMIVGGARLLPRRRFEAERPPEVKRPSERTIDAFERLSRGETIVLYPRRWRWAVLLVVSAAFAVGCLALLLTEPHVVAAVGLLLFGSGALVSLTQFFPRWAHLRIAPDGLILRHVLRTTRWSWNELDHFTPYEVHHQYGSQKLVGFDRRDLTPGRQSFSQTLTRGMTGVDGSLPDTYGLRHEELADLLNAARDRYATEHGPSPSLLADLELQRRAAAVPRDRLPVMTVALAVTCLAPT